MRTTSMRIARAIGSLSPLAILAIGWAIFLLYAFPGEVTWDSVSSLLEARSGVYTDRHPPVIATLWYWVEFFVAGSVGMLVIQSVTLLAGIYLVFRRALAPRAAAWAASAVLVFPPVMVTMAFIWPESLMAGFLMLGLGGLLSPHRGPRIIGMVAMLGASAVRCEAWAATLPIIVLGFRWGDLAGLRRYGVAVAAWLAVTLAAFGLDRGLTAHRTYEWHGSVAMHDIAGTLAHVDRDLPDSELRELLAGTDLLVDSEIHATVRRVYTPRDASSVIADPEHALWKVPLFGTDTLPEAQRDALERARETLISSHRGAFIRHRLSVARQLLWVGSKRSELGIRKRDFNDPVLVRGMGLATQWSELQLAMTSIIARIASKTPLFVPWIYAVIALVLLPLARRHRDVTALFASGLCLLGALVVAAPNRDLRLTHWMVLSTCIGVILLAARRRAGVDYEEPPLVRVPPVRTWLRELPERLGRTIAGLSPRALLVIGWLGFMLYAFPGFMSYDSVFQLLEARSGQFTDGHPPAMSGLWHVVDLVISGPFGMLVIQSVSFLVGAYLVLCHAMSRRAAAICAALVLWFPPVSTVMAVIWKDSQMAGLLMLGTGLLLSQRRGVRVLGLVVLAASTAMRYNALAMTFPIVTLLFVWSPSQHWFRRYAISIVAWIAVTASAQTVNQALTVKQLNVWQRSLALLDIAGTLRHTEPMSDAELRDSLEGAPLVVTEHLFERVNARLDPDLGFIDGIWRVALEFLQPPNTAPEREAVARAWKSIVLRHPLAYLAHRWDIFTRLVQLTGEPVGSGAYVWFTDVSDPAGSAARIEHNALPAGIQGELRQIAGEAGLTMLFRPYLYILLSLALLAFSFRDRVLFAVIGSGLTGEAGVFLLAPTTDYRYSFWLPVTAALGVMMLIAMRARRPAA